MRVKVAQLCVTLCDPMDCTVLGILQARILGWENFPGGTSDKNPPARAGDVVQSLIQEDLTCLGATEPMHHKNRAGALGPRSHNC